MRKSHDEMQARLRSFIDQLKERCALTDGELADIMGHRFTGDARKLPVGALTALTDHANVSLETVFGDNVDFEVVRRYLKGEKALPSRYVEGRCSSKRFTAAYMVDYVRRHWGDNAADGILRRFQLDADLMSEHGEANNIMLPRDIGQHIARIYGEEQAEIIGTHSVSLVKEKAGYAPLARCRNFKDFVSKFFYDVVPRQVEQNLRWEVLQLGAQEAVVKATVDPVLLENFREENVCVRSFETQRQGFMRGMFRHFLGVDPRITQTTRMSEGADADRYWIVLPHDPQPRLLH